MAAMIPLIEQKRAEIEELCRRFHVATLEVFGSAATGDFRDAESDLDFLVTFHRTPEMGPADQYFGLLEALERLFERRIDLVFENAMRNPYFIRSVNESRQSLYAA